MHLFCIEAEKHYGMGAIISIIDIEKKIVPLQFNELFTLPAIRQTGTATGLLAELPAVF